MWAQRAEIDAVANRETYLRELWAKALDDGRTCQPMRRRP